jgi:hypothetical protein
MDQGQLDENKRQIKVLQKKLDDKRSDIDRAKRYKTMRVRDIERQCDTQVKSDEDDCNNLSRQVEDLTRQSKR